MLAAIGQASLAARAAHAQDNPVSQPQVVVAATRQHAFQIPFRIEPARTAQEQPVEVQLHASSDQGATWEVVDRVKPDKTHFVYRARHDGEYWYAIRTVDAQGVARPEGQLQPQLKVVVDTVAPRLELTARRGAAGEIVARWQAVDPHLKPASFKLEYQTAPDAPWESVAVESPPSAMRHTSSGEATWWPRGGGDSLRVRAEVSDSAGNPAMNQAVIQLGAAASPAGSAPANNGNPSAGQGAATSVSWPADRATNDPLSNKDAVGSGPSGEIAVGADRREPPSQSLTGDPRRNTPTRAAAKPAAQTVRDPNKPSPLNFDLLPPGQRPRMVGSRTFELEYEVDSVGASGIGRVELWGTLDGGRTWSAFGADSDNRSPFNVRADKEGIYGFRVVVRSGSGLSGQQPAPGDAADVWIGVDLAYPAARITAAEVSDDGSELVVTWEAKDDALAVGPVSLEFSDSAQGPWTPVASGLENSGSYTWRLEPRLPPMIYLRMQVADEAGNISTIDWPNSISLDRSRPEGRIRDVRATK